MKRSSLRFDHRVPTPREVELIRALVRASRAPRAGDPACEPSLDGVDYRVILEAGRRHRLNPLLHAGAAASGLQARLPAFVGERLEDAFHNTLARSVVRLHHLDELAARAADTRLRLYLLKGLAFATSLYDNPALRPMADMDVLVASKDFDAWRVQLEELGYVHCESAAHADLFRRRQSGVFLELHRNLTAAKDFLQLETEELLERAVPVTGSTSSELRTLRPEDHLLHLCLHASFQHGFRQPAVNAWDARLLTEDLDWNTFLSYAKRPRLAPWIYGGLSMTQRVFPSDALDRALAEITPLQPARRRAMASRFHPAELLSPHPDSVFGAPFRRFSWAHGVRNRGALLLETLRPQDHSNSQNPATPSLRRAVQLLWNHGFRAMFPRDVTRLTLLQRPTSASLGELRDV